MDKKNLIIKLFKSLRGEKVKSEKKKDSEKNQSRGKNIIN